MKKDLKKVMKDNVISPVLEMADLSGRALCLY